VVLRADVPYARLLDVLRSVEPPAPVDFSAVDHYAGPPLAPGEFALTVRARLQPLERSLTDPEIESYRRALIDCLESRLGVRIRG
jgi:phenylalanyl-tRNA synthetase beta subunit